MELVRKANPLEQILPKCLHNLKETSIIWNNPMEKNTMNINRKAIDICVLLETQQGKKKAESRYIFHGSGSHSTILPIAIFPQLGQNPFYRRLL